MLGGARPVVELLQRIEYTMLAKVTIVARAVFRRQYLDVQLHAVARESRSKPSGCAAAALIRAGDFVPAAVAKSLYHVPYSVSGAPSNPALKRTAFIRRLAL